MAENIILSHEYPFHRNISRVDKAILQRFSLTGSVLEKGLFGLNSQRYRFYFENSGYGGITFYMVDLREKRVIAFGTLMSSTSTSTNGREAQQWIKRFQERRRQDNIWTQQFRIRLGRIHDPRGFLRMMDSLLVIPNQSLQQQRR